MGYCLCLNNQKLLDGCGECVRANFGGCCSIDSFYQKQKNLRLQSKTIGYDNEETKIYKKNKMLQDICLYGSLIKQNMWNDKIYNSNNYILIEDALKYENIDVGLFALGLLGNCLQQNNIEVTIKKKINYNENDNNEEDISSLQFITNNIFQKKKYNFNFDFGQTKNEEYLDNNKFSKLSKNLQQKLSEDYNIPTEQIIVSYPNEINYDNPKKGLNVQVIFQSDSFNELDLEQFKLKFKNDIKYPELRNLKEIHSDLVMEACKLSIKQLDPDGNRVKWGPKGEKRGNKPYNPPYGWIGIGIRVIDKFGDNLWLGMNNSKDEWCVAYHGLANSQQSEQVKKTTRDVISGGLKKGINQIHKDCNDQFHPGQKVGEGVYITPLITIAEIYAGVSNVNGKKYKTAMMVRVKPQAIRACTCQDSNYWVVNGTYDEIRPYRILYKLNN